MQNAGIKCSNEIKNTRSQKDRKGERAQIPDYVGYSPIPKELFRSLFRFELAYLFQNGYGVSVVYWYQEVKIR